MKSIIQFNQLKILTFMRNLILLCLIVLTLSKGHETDMSHNTMEEKEHAKMAQKHSYHHLKIHKGSRFTIMAAEDYKMESDQDCSYKVDGLPEGIELKGDMLKVHDDVAPGNYIVRVRCDAKSGKAHEKIISLSVIHHHVGQGMEHQEDGMKMDEKMAQNKINPDDERLRNVIKSYSTVTKTEEKSYQDNKFPEVDFPTGTNPSSINLVPTQISSTTTTPSSSNRNDINAQDVALRAASERHQNAIKAITNLLSIIDQARANRDYAQKNLEMYIKAYNDALSAQRKAQNAIIAAETRRSQILSAIEGVQRKIEDLKDKIAELEKHQDEYNMKKKELMDILAGEQKMKAELLAEVDGINSDLAARLKELAEAKEKCQSIMMTVNSIKKELAEAEDRLANVVIDRMEAERMVSDRENAVQRLRRQLQAAENDLADAQIKLAGILEIQNNMPGQIKRIKARLAAAEKQYNDCQRNVMRIQAIIDSLETDDLTREIEDLEESILENRKRAMEIDEMLASLVEPLENAKAQLKGAQEDLLFLRAQIIKAEETLRETYIAGNDANTLVAHAKQNLDAINARYKAEQKVISEATLNLQRARAQEALARLALEEIIAHYSDALPYAIVPNGNGETDAGVPKGNNPSGSPLGPVNTDGYGAPGEYVISDWTHYLSMAYGAGVDPNFKGSVTKLYPFSFSSMVHGNKVKNDQQEGHSGVCGGYGPVRVASGVVTEMYDHGFRVMIENGQQYDIEVSDCTRMSANKKGYKMRKGDKAIVKGAQKTYSRMHASQMTCLRE